MKYSIKAKQITLALVYSIGFILLLSSCSKGSYITDIPKTFTFNDDEIRQELFNTKKTENVKETTKPVEETVVVQPTQTVPGLTERQAFLREKYSKMLEANPGEINNFTLYSLIDLWLYVPYAPVGMSKEQGVSNAGFVSNYFNEAYKVQLPTDASGLYQSGQFDLFSDKKYLATGDVVFLRNVPSMTVSDVALYLANNYVLFSSPDRGLYIYKFSDPYFQERYLSSGRLR